nr:copia protein [Tanacetum cinerariifolium]
MERAATIASSLEAKQDSDESASTQEDLNVGTYSRKEAISKDYIVMPIWKDVSYFDSPSNDVEDGPHNEDDDKDKSEDHSSPKEVNTAEQHVNIASLEVNTGASNPLEATHVKFFNDRDAKEVDLGNIPSLYGIPTTSHTRIHKDHLIKNVIGYWNKMGLQKDERGIVIRNKERLVAQGYRQEEGIDYEEIFTHVARIKAIILFLAYASFMGFLVYQMDVKSAFLYGTIEEEIYVDDIIFRSTNKQLCTTFEKLMKDKFQMSSMGELTLFMGLQVTQKKDGIFISQDKYVNKILKKFNYTDVKSASTPVDLKKPLVKDRDANDVDVYLYRSMIGSLMYLTASKPDIMFAAGSTQDMKSTTGGCQFLGNGLISWQCKKQTMVATSTTEAEYVVAASCRGQVLWIQNQLLDYGYNFMNTVIRIDNTSTICIIENPV